MINLLPTVVCFHFLEPLGSSTGKCSHGGPDDESRTSVAHDKYHLQLNNWWLPLQRRHMPVYAGSDGETN
jgi:hypothetical protein